MKGAAEGLCKLEQQQVQNNRRAKHLVTLVDSGTGSNPGPPGAHPLCLPLCRLCLNSIVYSRA
jgi:hypothetical protein